MALEFLAKHAPYRPPVADWYVSGSEVTVRRSFSEGGEPLVLELREWWKLGKMVKEGQLSPIDVI